MPVLCRTTALAVLVTSLCVALLARAGAELIITEFVADNRDGLLDGDGEASDWIEIHNLGDAGQNLAGWSLSDDPALPARWLLPDVTLPAGGYLLIFASGKDRSDPAAELHTNFSLNAGGEHLILAAPDGTVASSYEFPEQRTDIAYGRSGQMAESVLVPEGGPARWLVPDGAVPGWIEPGFDDSAWAAGTLGLGYDFSADFEAYIDIDTREPMYNERSSAYLRVEFTVAAPSQVDALTLKVRYDDGFVAWINGQRVAAANAPDAPQWDSAATDLHLDSEAIEFEHFDLAAAIPHLREGSNTLAVQALNANATSADLLMSPELVAGVRDADAPRQVGYLLQPTPGAANGRALIGFVEDTKFSVDRGFYNTPIDVAITSATPGAAVRYTTDGSDPSPHSGTVYTGPVRIAATTTLRAIAFREGYRATDIDTQTYLFAADVKTQPEMDPDVVEVAPYAETIESDLAATLPVVALTLEHEPFFGAAGIYSNPFLSGRAAEVPASLEFFEPGDGGASFRVGAGVRIHGGNARAHPKKPLRLYFRDDYGDRRLREPLFAGSPVESFDQLILRPGGHDSWSLADTFGRDPDTDLPAHGTILRDQFLRRTEIDMGMISPRGRHVHVFINRRYWGVYDLHERANAAFFEAHLGGAEEDYDVLHHPEVFGEDYVAVDGDGAAWDEARAIAAGRVSGRDQFEALGGLIDVDNLIDHLIVRMWGGDYDWCGPVAWNGDDVTYFDSKNWYAGRRSRGDQPGRFHFFCWDAEMSMGNHLMYNLNPFDPPAMRVPDLDLTGASDPGSPLEFYAALREYVPFRVRFGDRLHKHLFNDGAMSVVNNRRRWDQLWGQLREPMVAESARWGDEGAEGGEEPFTRNTTWLPEVFWIRNTYIPTRNAELVSQFRARGLYPDTAAPTFSQHGGEVPEGYALEIASPGNVIYYTDDGSDPYVVPERREVVLIGDGAPARAFVPLAGNGGAALSTAQWTGLAEPANLAAWSEGTTGVGYEVGGGAYGALIGLDVVEAYGDNPGAYVRVPFELPADLAPGELLALTLRMKYDDGFVAYLNGVRVASANAPAAPGWNSAASTNRPDLIAAQFQSFDLSASLAMLQPGANVLALHLLNDGANSSDMLGVPTLEASVAVEEGGVAPTAQAYTGPVALDATSQVRARAVDQATGEWSALTEATFLVGELASASNLVVSELHYYPAPPQTPAERAVAGGRTDFEFLELTNVGPGTIDLTGVSFSQGIEFEFAFGEALNALAPGASVLVVEDAAAMVARYGGAVNAFIAGEFAGDTKLSNNGEAVTLLAADGAVIQSFRYSAAPPWPVAPDGGGYPIELVSAATMPDHTAPENWRLATFEGGTPAGLRQLAATAFSIWAQQYFDPTAPGGVVDSRPGADPDADGWPNLAEFAFGTIPDDPGSQPGLEVFIATIDGLRHLAVRYPMAAEASGSVLVSGEFSEGLAAWSGDTIDMGVVGNGTDGRQRRALRASAPLGEGSQQLRLRLELLE